MDALAPGHVIVIAIAALVLFFGWKQLPEMTRSLGRSLRILRTEIKGMAADGDIGRAMRNTFEDARAELVDVSTALSAPAGAPETASVPHPTTS